MASPSSTSKRLYELDLLRFVAAVAVVLFHLSFLGERSGASPSAFPTLAHATKYGYLGVDFFFILSGFVILMSAKGRSAVSFARARVVRLFPAYIAAVALTSGVLYLDGRGPSSGQFVANLTMTQAVFREGHIDGAYWSLLVEMRFYALIAVVIAVGGLKHVENLTLAWLGYLLITDFVALPSIASTVLIDQHAHLFIAGMTYALVRAEQQMTTRRLVVLMWCWASATTMALGQAEVMATRHETPFYPAVIVGASVLFFATFALIALRGMPGLRRPWFAVLGGASYPLYLLHQEIGYVMFQAATANRWVVLVAVLVGTTLVSHLIATRLEAPVAAWAKRRYSNSGTTSSYTSASSPQEPASLLK